MAGLAAGAAAGLAAAGSARWHARTRALHARLVAGRAPAVPAVVDFERLDGLPPPVERYLRAALTEGHPLIRAVHISHAGTFNMREDGEAWKPFTSHQYVIIDRPGFVWDGRVRMFAGVTAHVHDAYVGGAGLLDAALAGVIPVAHMEGSSAVDEGELMRFLAESAWYPTMLLPSDAVRWTAIDDVSARVALRDADLEVALTFGFGAGGLVTAVRAEARGRTVGGGIVPTPWEGRWSGYERRGGMLVPSAGEVAWIVDGRRRPYWRGRIISLEYEF